MSLEYIRFFKCPKCHWWVVGKIDSSTPVNDEEIAAPTFDLRCEAEGCGWAGKLAGALGQRPRPPHYAPQDEN